MTYVLMDGFDHYGSGAVSVANLADGPYASVNQVDCAAPPWGAARTGAFCLVRGGGIESGAYGARRVLPATGSNFFFRFGFAIDTIQAGIYNNIIAIMDGSAGVIAQLGWTSTGALVLTKADGTVLGQTSGPVIVTQNWHYFEMQFDTATNTFVLRVDDASGVGTPVLTVTNAAITGTIAQFGVLMVPDGTVGYPTIYMDDLQVNDAAGSVNNGFLGDRRVATLFADADTATAGWTPRYYKQLGAGILNNTALSPFGGGYASGVSAASSTSLNLGAADFTIETFVRFQGLPTASDPAVIFGKWDATANQRSYQLFLGSVALNGGALCFQESTDGTNSTVTQPIVYPWAPELDTWYHLALVRASGELLLFVDGGQLGLPIADTNTYFAGAAPCSLGVQSQLSGSVQVAVSNTAVQGWLDESRLTVGFARYTSNFTPTTVEFPRGSADPEWADVAWLTGFDSLIQDESGFSRALTVLNGAVQFTTNDGPSVGVWSTVGKAVPDDNTFVEAPFLPAASVLTLSAQPAANDTVRVGTKDGTTAATYTFKSALTTAFDVLIDTSLQQTLQNLFNAINAGPGAGAKYGTATTSNFDVSASQLPAGQMAVTALRPGTTENAVSTTVSLTHGGGWTGATLAGGAAIPGPSDFKVQLPPPLTTIISAVQVTQRAFKSDAGAGSVQAAFVGGLGNVTTGAAHALTVSPSYYGDIFELDPDTGAAISPATLINGSIQINRTL
jgi:hypothetical protein